MGIVSGGVGSGLDVESLVSQLMSLERKPITKLQQTKQTVNSQISAYGRVKSDLSALQTAANALKSGSAFDFFKATSSATSVLSASASTGAIPATHTINVTSLAAAEIKTSQGFNSKTATLGSLGLAADDTLTISTNSASFNITVTTSDTLQTVSQKIAAGLNGDGTTQTIAQASVINAGTTASPAYKLVVSSSSKGTDNAITLSGGAAAFFSFAQSQQASNASLKVDGVQIDRSDNKITDIIDGVTLNLTDKGSTTLTIGRDVDAIKAKVTDLTKAYNQLVSTISGLRDKDAVLSGDATLTSAISQIQSAFNSGNSITGTSYRWLSEVGISFQKDGTIAVSSDFDTAINNNFDQVVALFTDSTSGKAKLVYDQVHATLQTDGLVDSRTKGLTERTKYIDDRISQMETRMASVEARLRRQFSSLDSLVGTLKQTSSYLSRQLG